MAEASDVQPAQEITISGRWGKLTFPAFVVALMLGNFGSSWFGSRGAAIGLTASQADSIAQHVADVAIRRSEAIQAVERGRVMDRLDTIASQVSDLQVAFVHDRAHPPRCTTCMDNARQVSARRIDARSAGVWTP